MDWLPGGLVLFALFNIVGSRYDNLVRAYCKLFSWETSDSAVRYTQKQMFYGGLIALFIGTVTQWHFIKDSYF